jgi:hypothetical protein
VTDDELLRFNTAAAMPDGGRDLSLSVFASYR